MLLTRYVDSHCNLHEFSDEEVVELARDYVIVAVSDDLESTLRTLKLAKEHENVIACAGVHPWSLDEVSDEEIVEVLKVIERGEVDCVGEVGLDKVFVPKTWGRQQVVFRQFLKAAREQGLPVNVHSPGAWREALDFLRKFDIERAVFHWYTGPLDLLEEIGKSGYFISANPAIKIQRKHREVVSRAPLNMLLTESDGPYEYRGLRLTPRLLPELVRQVSEIKGVEEERLVEIVKENFRRFIGK